MFVAVGDKNKKGKGDMESKIARDVRYLKIYAGVITLVCGVLLLTAFQSSKNQKFSEIDVERINVVEKDGRLKMVISNAERQHPGMNAGKLIERKEGRDARILFFNDHGDECAGFEFGGKIVDGKTEAYGSFTMDQFGQDETLKLKYEDFNGWRRAAMIVQDRSNVPQPEWAEKYKAAMKMKDGPEKDAALKPLSAPYRAYFGKTRENGSAVLLSDTEGRTRISMMVDKDGKASLNFLDEKGNVIQSFPDVQTKKAKK
jgi:hypothetical protein